MIRSACTVDEAERLEQPQVEETAPEPTPEETAQLKAQKELALRALSRKHLLPFVERFNPDYLPGWVHMTYVYGWKSSAKM